MRAKTYVGMLNGSLEAVDLCFGCRLRIKFKTEDCCRTMKADREALAVYLKISATSYGEHLLHFRVSSYWVALQFGHHGLTTAR